MQGWKGGLQSLSDWPQMGQIWVFYWSELNRDVSPDLSHLGLNMGPTLPSQNVLKCDLEIKKSRIFLIWGQSDPLWCRAWQPWSINVIGSIQLPQPWPFIDLSLTMLGLTASSYDIDRLENEMFCYIILRRVPGYLSWNKNKLLNIIGNHRYNQKHMCWIYVYIISWMKLYTEREQ